MIPPEIPCRVHIVFARRSPMAVAIRRGPSKRVCTIAWDREKDSFQVGQWIKGRIYERRCDLSPDGRHFIYFAMNGRWKSETKGSWTAISFAPYLKAVGLWANGSGWNGGGLFTSDQEFWLNTFAFGNEELRRPGKLKRVPFPFHESYGGECPGVYYVRLQRDGWRLVRHEIDRQQKHRNAFTLFEKPLGKGWLLEKLAHETSRPPSGKGCYFDTHRLRRESGTESIDCPEWEWADLDGRRVVWIDKGILYAAYVTHDGLDTPKPLFDFNVLTYEERKAPY